MEISRPAFLYIVLFRLCAYGSAVAGTKYHVVADAGVIPDGLYCEVHDSVPPSTRACGVTCSSAHPKCKGFLLPNGTSFSCAVCSMYSRGSLLNVGYSGKLFLVKPESFVGLYFPMDVILGGEILGAFNGTVYGGARLEPGIRASALYVDGITGAVTLGNQRHRCLGNLVECSSGFTLSLWIKFGLKPVVNDMYYFCSGGQTSQSHGIAFYGKFNDDIFCNFKEETNNWLVNAVDIQKLVWYHVTATWNRIDGARMYVNGRLVSQVESASSSRYSPSGYDTVEIGRPNNYAPHTGDRHYGEAYMDDMYIFEHDIEEDEILDLYLSYF